MKNLLITAALVLTLTACSTSHPIYNAQSSVPVENISKQELKKSIVKAILFKRWRVLSETDNTIVAGINVRKHYAEVTITYDESNFTINYRDSNTLDYNPQRGTIHRNYNKWITLLENEIQSNIILEKNNY